MATNVSNVVLGAATLYWGTNVAVEPTDATTALGSGWTDVGGTTDGVTISYSADWTKLEVDQAIDTVGSRMTSREITISTNLAEPTLANLKVALNGGTVTTSGASSTYDVVSASSAAPTYTPLIIECIAPGGKKRRIIIRKALQTGDVEFAYSKEDQTVFSVEFTAHYVSSVLAPITIIDEV